MGDDVEFLEDENMIVDPSAVIAGASKEKFKQIAIIGLTEDDEFYIYSSHPADEMEDMIEDAFDTYFGDEDNGE